MPKITWVLIAFIAALLWVFVFADYTEKKPLTTETIEMQHQ